MRLRLNALWGAVRLELDLFNQNWLGEYDEDQEPHYDDPEPLQVVPNE